MDNIQSTSGPFHLLPSIAFTSQHLIVSVDVLIFGFLKKSFRDTTNDGAEAGAS